MSGRSGTPEIISNGGEWELGAVVADRLRAHPRWVAAALIPTLLAAAGAAYLTSPRIRAAPLPELRTTTVVAGGMSPGLQPPAWQPGPDGRPAGPVRVALTAELGFTGMPPGGIKVLGMTGPGILEGSTPRIRIPSGQAPWASLQAEVDCTAVDLPVPAGAYRLRVSVSDRQGAPTRVLPAGELSRQWADAVQNACGSWTARRYLTVSAVTAAVDRVLPAVDLDLTVANGGRRDAMVQVVTAGHHDLRVTHVRPGPGRVPAESYTSVRLHVNIRDCSAVSQLRPGPTPLTTEELVGLVAMTGPAGTSADPNVRAWGFGPTGILLAPPAAAVAVGALRSACGGLGPILTLIARGGLRYDTGSRLVTMTVRLLPGGRVLDLQLISDQRGDTASFVPSWIVTPRLVPDRAGQVTATLKYLAPAFCTVDGWSVPSISMVVRVQAPEGVRILHYSQGVDPAAVAAAVRHLCHGGP